MTEPVFLDANSFKQYVDCQMLGGTGTPTVCVDHLKQAYHFALDDGELFMQEWKDCTGGFTSEFVQSIIGDLIIANIIRTYPRRNDDAVKRKFRMMGVPAKDLRIVCFAICVDASGIITSDIDFYDPQANGQGEARRLAIIEGRLGPVCRQLQRDHGILVVSLEASPHHL
jgi:hypothetical protein